MSVKKIEDIDSFNFEISSSEDILVKFEADWCSPCKAITPVVEEIAKQNPEIKFISVDIDGEGIETVIKEYSVRSLPAFVRIRNGSAIKTHIGTISKSELSDFVGK